MVYAYTMRLGASRQHSAHPKRGDMGMRQPGIAWVQGKTRKGFLISTSTMGASSSKRQTGKLGMACVCLCALGHVWGGYPCMYLHQGIDLFLKNILSAVLLTLPFILFTAATVFAWMGYMNLVLSSGFVPSPNLVYITLERTHL